MSVVCTSGYRSSSPNHSGFAARAHFPLLRQIEAEPELLEHLAVVAALGDLRTEHGSEGVPGHAQPGRICVDSPATSPNSP